jgi:PAS domain S-box-containing protein
MNDKTRDELVNEIQALQQENISLKESLNKSHNLSRQAEEASVQLNSDILKLNQFAVELSMLSSDRNLKALIIKLIKEFSGATFAMYSDYDPVSRTLITEHIELEPGLLGKFVGMVSKKGSPIRSEVNDEMFQYITREVAEVRKTLYEVSFGTIPRPIANAIQSLLKVDRFIGISYLLKGELYGTSLLGMPRDKPDPGMQILKNFISLASVSLRRKIAEDAIRDSKNKYRRLIDNSPDIVYIFSTKRGGIFYSPSVAKILGYSIERFSENPFLWNESIHPDDVERVKNAIVESSEGLSFAVEYRIRNAFNEWIWLFDRSIEMKGLPGEILIEGMATDITVRKTAEQALKQSKEYSENLIRTANVMIVGLDIEGHVNAFNETAEKISGYCLADFDGKNCFEVLAPKAYYPKVWNEFMLITQNGKVPLEFENPILTKTGEERIISWQNSVIYENGKICGTISFGNDITARKQAEEVVRKKDLEFRKLSANIPDLVYQFTRKPDGTYFVPIASEGIRNIFGCSPEDVLDDFGPIGRVIYPEDVERVIHDIEYSAEHLTHFTCEFRVQIPGRELQWIYSNSTPERLSDGSVTWYGFNVDITNRKLFEQELQKAKEKAEESDRLKSAFLANMSHEIRTPMNGILGFAELLKEPNLGGEEQQEYIKIIEKSGARMLNIINEIVDISKVESGQMNVSVSETNMNDQLDFLFKFFHAEAEKKGLQLISKTTFQQRDSIVFTDREKLFSILTNLIKNAIKYTDKGSIVFGCELKDEIFEFFVKDTGIGIHKNRQEAIFERFVQADIEDIQARQGAGLGLSISKAFVEMLGGRIWVESELGVGSTFYFTLPNQNASSKRVLNESTDSNSNPGIANSPFVPQLKILIAEDDETSQMFLSLLLKNISREVLLATDGLKAVEMCRNNPDINLILMDINIPEMGGYEATRQIRQFNLEVVIIAQTAYSLLGDMEKSIQAGCNDYISKPINSKDLNALIMKYFIK